MIWMIRGSCSLFAGGKGKGAGAGVQWAGGVQGQRCEVHTLVIFERFSFA